MIVGAGTGGLCLAQGLKLNNISVELFERDYSPTDRLQGYRLSIDTALIRFSGKPDFASVVPQVKGISLSHGRRYFGACR
jgi:2-polyprenyl-6-methoxyphenol hydroxylase-like FAD-dependent oxidoreductase